MNQLREALVLVDARAISLTRHITKDGSTYVFVIQAPLNRDIANVLKCERQLYNLNDNPYPGLSALKLDHEISSCEFSVAGYERLRPTVVAGFTIRPSELADSEGELDVHFRMKFTEGGKSLNVLLDAVKNNNFDMALEALQGGLFDQPEEKTDGPAGGTRVEMKGAIDGHAGADQDEEPLPIIQAVMEGARPEDALAEAESGTLPSAREMGSGTHQAGTKQRRRRGPAVAEEEVSPEEAVAIQ